MVCTRSQAGHEQSKHPAAAEAVDRLDPILNPGRRRKQVHCHGAVGAVGEKIRQPQGLIRKLVKLGRFAVNRLRRAHVVDAAAPSRLGRDSSRSE